MKKISAYSRKIWTIKGLISTGIFNGKNVVIPIKRVKYADNRQGIILKKYKLINLKVHTAGAHYVIPYLDIEVGKSAQLSISKFVQVRSI